MATSTVADFERGHRTPVPNNAEAMRAALDRAGISFLPGGAVEGPVIPTMAEKTKSGAPIRWVNATDLGQWAERRDGQGSMPTVLSMLARATGVASVHFPSDEGVQFAGWDGITRADAASEYVPAGITGWEIGTQRENITSKANDNYQNRTESPGTLIPAESCFIFVTPRHWSGKDGWVQEKRAQGIWRDVRAYDGADLVHWIELYPAVGQWLATSMGKRPEGTRQLEELWLEWSLATECALTREVVLTDRDEDAVAVLRWLRSEPSVLALGAESAEEAAAFAYAAITELPPDNAEPYLARCIVADTAPAARALAGSSTRLVIVLLEPQPGIAEAIAKKGHHVLVTYGDRLSSRDNVRDLARPSREGIECALKYSGLDEEKAKQVARDSSRSLTILRRLMPARPGRTPKWAEQPPPRALLAALMVGAWDDNAEGDRAILSRLADMPYPAIVSDLAALVGPFDSPLRKVGSVWKLASPKDAWLLLARYLSPPDIDTLQAVLADVLGAADPRYEMDPKERWYAPLKGIKPTYSEPLRHGLGEILIMLALFGDRVTTVPDAAERPEAIVRKLLHGADAKRWWSLSHDFRLLAEAAPRAFLEAVDQSLGESNPAIEILFKSENDDGFFGEEHLSDLLWALESLAWSPQYLRRVAGLLVQLDEIDPGVTRGNRPGNSLRDIFLLWLPQTHTTLDERLRVVDALRKRHPRGAWKLMLSILPSGYDSVTPTATTRWRDLSVPSETVTYPLLAKGTKSVSDRLLADAGGDVNRWGGILDRLSNFPDRGAVIEALSRAARGLANVSERAALWGKLRTVLRHHGGARGADWAISDEELAALRALYEELTPEDPLVRAAWLFGHSPALPDPIPMEKWQELRQQIDAKRRDAALAIFRAKGLEGIRELTQSVEDPFALGGALIHGGIAAGERDALLDRALRSDSRKDHLLAAGIVTANFQPENKQWVETLLTNARQAGCNENALITILLAFPVRRWSWSLAHHCGTPIEATYWREIPWINVDSSDVGFVAEKLLGSGRALDAVCFLGYQLRKETIPSSLLVHALREAVRQQLPSEPNQTDLSMFQHHVAEILTHLDDASDVTEETMVGLEWGYLSLLEYSQRPPKVIMRALAHRPDLFVQLICALYKPSADSGVVEEPPPDLEMAKKLATQVFHLFRMWNTVPGTTSEEMIDERALEEWVKEARRRATAAGRGAVADLTIGEILAASPLGTDGIWPAEPVRELLESVRSEHIDEGFVNGRRNRRGVTGRLPRDGGKQERALHAQYSKFAKATAVDWPRTSALLENLASTYLEEAAWHDQQVEQLDW